MNSQYGDNLASSSSNNNAGDVRKGGGNKVFPRPFPNEDSDGFDHADSGCHHRTLSTNGHLSPQPPDPQPSSQQTHVGQNGEGSAEAGTCSQEREIVADCGTCGGFYGPNFGQPLCATCHAFLHPEDINSFWPMPYGAWNTPTIGPEPGHVATQMQQHPQPPLPGPSHAHEQAGPPQALNQEHQVVGENTQDAKSDSGDSGNEDLDPPLLDGDSVELPEADDSSLDDLAPLADNISMTSSSSSSSRSSGNNEEGGDVNNPQLQYPHHHQGVDEAGPSGMNNGGVNNGELAQGYGRLAEQILMLTDTKRVQWVSNNTLRLGAAANLPLGVLFNILGKLDDLSLWVCSRVCHRWSGVVQSFVSDGQWRDFISQRWPIFPLHSPLDDPPPPDPSLSGDALHHAPNMPLDGGHYYYNLYSRLVLSAPCLTCLFSVKPNPTFSASEDIWKQQSLLRPPGAVLGDVPILDENTEQRWRQRIRSEWRSLQTELPLIEGIDARPLTQEYQRWMASIEGPVGSPYEGGLFFLLVLVPDPYPMRPPVVRFLTRIFHPNVSAHGDVGLDVLQHNWSLALTLVKVILSIQSLLTDPNPDICMEPDIGRLYSRNPGLYETVAKEWTLKYAKFNNINNNNVL